MAGYDSTAETVIPTTLSPAEFQRLFTHLGKQLSGGNFDPGFKVESSVASLGLAPDTNRNANVVGIVVELERYDDPGNTYLFPFWKAGKLVWEHSGKPIGFAWVGGQALLSLATAYDFHLARLAAAAQGVRIRLLDADAGFRDHNMATYFAKKSLEPVRRSDNKGQVSLNSDGYLAPGNYFWRNLSNPVTLWRQNEVDYHAYGQAVDIASEDGAVEWMREFGPAFGFLQEEVSHHDSQYEQMGPSQRSTFTVEEHRNHFVHKSSRIEGFHALQGSGLVAPTLTGPPDGQGRAYLAYHLKVDGNTDVVSALFPVPPSPRVPKLPELADAVKKALGDAARAWHGASSTAPKELGRTALFMNAVAGQGLSARKRVKVGDWGGETTSGSAGASPKSESRAVAAYSVTDAENNLYDFQSGKWGGPRGKVT